MSTWYRETANATASRLAAAAAAAADAGATAAAATRENLDKLVDEVDESWRTAMPAVRVTLYIDAADPWSLV